MQFTRRLLLGASATAFTLARPGLVRAQGTTPIRIGEINSYTTQPAFTLPYRDAMHLAVEEINGKGGVLGRPLELITRDDAGKPQDAVRLAGELLNEAKADVLAGAYLSNVGLALGEYAAQNRRLYVAGEPLTDAMVWEKGNRFTFRLRPSTYMQASILAEEAAKLPAKRWVTVAPNYEYGQSAVKWFRQILSARRPDVQFVGEQWPALGRIDGRP
ncbi:ABC transporter substrate-binding protein [Roseomonas mucosa]|uniref:ABC transporter substrate-binding protein n=1 Tax=Roseomonas mucosa TaxID=207340 RepID=UPI003BAE1867